MKKQLLFLTLILFSCCTFGAKLVYKWKAESVYRFQANVTDDISTSIDMMGIKSTENDIYKTECLFALKVNSVQPNGTAEGILYVENYKVTNKAGQVVASLAGVPKEALKSAVEVDKKGNFRFIQYIYIAVQETGNLLLSAKVSPTSASATATSPDGQQITHYAEFDPKTGTLKAGYTVQNVGTPKTKKVAVKEDAPKLNVIPYDFIELLLLPEGDFVAGQTFNMKSPGYDMTVKAESLIANIATIGCTFKSDVAEMTGKNKPSNSNNSNTGGMDMMNMDMNMGDMGGDMNMDMGNMTGGMSSEEKAMIPESTTDGTIKSTFDTGLGVFKTINGTINTTMDSQGISMKTKSVLVMKGL